MPIIQDPPQPDRHKLVPQCTHIPIERQPFEIDVRRAQDGGPRGLVTPPGFDADEPVFDDVDPADAVFACEGVEGEEYLDGVCVRLVGVGHGHFDGETSFEFDGDVIGRRGGGFDGLGELPHVGGGRGVGVFKDPGFVGDVEEVFVGRPRFGGGLLDWDLFFGSIGEEGLTTGETVVKLCVGGGRAG